MSRREEWEEWEGEEKELQQTLVQMANHDPLSPMLILNILMKMHTKAQHLLAALGLTPESLPESVTDLLPGTSDNPHEGRILQLLQPHVSSCDGLLSECLLVCLLESHLEVPHAAGVAIGMPRAKLLLKHLLCSHDTLDHSVPPFSSLLEKHSIFLSPELDLPALRRSALPRFKEQKNRKSPSPHTHWLLPRMVMCGAAPGRINPTESRQMCEALVASGITVMVNLQTSYREYGCDDYREHRCLQHGMAFLHMPIGDHSAPSPKSLQALIRELLRLLYLGHSLYIHCYGGHGRTGLVAACLLAAIDGQGVEETMLRLRDSHAARTAGCYHGRCALSFGRLEAPAQEAVLYDVFPWCQKQARIGRLDN